MNLKDIIHSLPCLIRSTHMDTDLNMARLCIQSLAASVRQTVVIYNQGALSNNELTRFLSQFSLDFIVLGDAQNVGIAKARQACFEYIWSHEKNVSYISEIHLDMMFPQYWYTSLIDYLKRTDEPMVSPGILTSNAELHPQMTYVEQLIETMSQGEILLLLASLESDTVLEGFVHPVIHKSKILMEVGGYDTKFLSGKQGYEDDSLLLGYLYYMGTKTKWKPKCYLKTCVYHATMAQRMSLADKEPEFDKNLLGLKRQYGVYGLIHLGNLHRQGNYFSILSSQFQNESIDTSSLDES